MKSQKTKKGKKAVENHEGIKLSKRRNGVASLRLGKSGEGGKTLLPEESAKEKIPKAENYRGAEPREFHKGVKKNSSLSQ